jgi:hypothetical protein
LRGNRIHRSRIDSDQGLCEQRTAGEKEKLSSGSKCQEHPRDPKEEARGGQRNCSPRHVIGKQCNLLRTRIEGAEPIGKKPDRKVITWRRDGGFAKGSIRFGHNFIALSKFGIREFVVGKIEKISDLGSIQRYPRFKKPPRTTDMASRVPRK